MRLGQQGQKVRLPIPCRCSAESGQALAYLYNSFLCLSLRSECPAPQDSTPGYEERNSLLSTERNQRIGLLLGCLFLPAQLMNSNSSGQGDSKAKGMSQLLRQGKGLVARLECLVGIAQLTQGKGRKHPTGHIEVLLVKTG
jgi:hypothetical protein